jgi:hypothetical protein
MMAAIATLGCVLPAASLTPADDVPMAVSPFSVKWARMPLPKWSNGSLIVPQNHHSVSPLVWLFERLGARTVPFAIPGAVAMNIYDWDHGVDGTIGLSGSAADPEGRATGFIAWISPDGTTSHVIRTGLYRPSRVAVAPDGTLWAAGSEAAQPVSNVFAPNAAVLRHFHRSGQILGSFVPQSTFQDPIRLVGPYSFLRASRDRIAWYLAQGRYVEISLDEKVLTDILTLSPKPEVGGFALTDRGEAFVSVQWNDSLGHHLGIYTLDRSTKAWRSLLQSTKTGTQASRDSLGHIYGVDGRMLVLNGAQRLRRLKIQD